eukprot:SAG22_NODE_6074_length_905_cov_0.696030_2_plen_149_part_01
MGSQTVVSLANPRVFFLCEPGKGRGGGGRDGRRRPEATQKTTVPALVLRCGAGSTRSGWGAQRTRSEGDGTRISRHRDRTGPTTLLALEHESTSRQPAEYFSIVRRSAAWAGVESWSTSFSTTTLNGRAGLAEIACDDAISLMTSCTTP